MTGLEKILSQIEYESDDRCKTIIANAEAKAQEIISEAEAQAKTEADKSREAIEKRVEDIKQSTASSVELNKSKIILKAKLEAIDEMLSESLKTIKSLPDREYFDMLKTLILNNAKDGEGVLHLSEKDCKRLNDGFIADVNNSLGGGKSVVLGDNTDIDSGFVLVYGDIDINCSFDAIVSSKRDELRDTLNALLFTE